MDIAGWSVIVTGGGTGVGAAAAEKLAAAGANVLINYSQSAEAAEAVAEACRAAGVGAVTCQGGVGEEADCQKIARAALEESGRIDGLLSNAGITRFHGADDFNALTAEDFLDIYRINVVGCFQMTRAVTAQMRARAGAAW